MKRTIRFIFFVTVVISAVVFSTCASSSSSGSNGKVWNLLANGDERAMDYFVGEFDVNETNEIGWTPLHFAAVRDNQRLANFFIAMGADVNAQDISGLTPLGVAAQIGNYNSARAMVEAGANIHLGTSAGDTAAELAFRPGNELFLKAILTPESIASTDKNGRTILHMATEQGNLDAVEAILAVIAPSSGTGRVPVVAGERNTPLDTKDSSGRDSLDIAFSFPESKIHMEIAEQLVLAGSMSQNPIDYYFSPAVRNANYNLKRGDGLAPLHYAASHGYTGLIEFLVERGANINIQNSSGATPLHEAVRSGNTEAVSFILDNGADINAQDSNGNTVLHLAVPPANHAAMIRLLLQRGIDPNSRDVHGDSPLHVLISLNRSPEVVRALLSGRRIDLSVRNIRGQTPLHVAVQENRIALIPILLENGSDIFATDNSGVTPFGLALQQRGQILESLITVDTAKQADSMGNTMLHMAVQAGVNTTIIGNILDKNAVLNMRNRDGDTPLHIAARMNQREAGEFLLDRGADVFSANSQGDSPLRLALTHRSGVLQWMFNPRTVRSTDSTGNTMLHYVALWRMDRQIEFMRQQGIPVDAANGTGETPLFWAVHHDGASTVKALLDARANINARDSLGNSALHSAVRWNAINATNALLDAGMDVNAISLNGTSSLHDAVRLGNIAIAQILINRRANLEVRDSDGNTPFMEAVKAGHVEAANLLARSGADPMTRNSGGDTPLHFAVAAADSVMIDALLGMGVSIHARNTRNRTPFQIALADSPETLSALLGGNRINSTDDYGNSPLHVAIQARVPVATLQVIVSRNSAIRLNPVDSNGRTPMRLAAELGAWDLAKVLADSGADPFMAAVDGRTTSEIAIRSGHMAIESIFSGAAIEARDPSGNTVLHLAARIGDQETIRMLLGLGANMGIRNIAGESPADVAMRWNRRENAALLN